MTPLAVTLGNPHQPNQRNGPLCVLLGPEDMGHRTVGGVLDDAPPWHPAFTPHVSSPSLLAPRTRQLRQGFYLLPTSSQNDSRSPPQDVTQSPKLNLSPGRLLPLNLLLLQSSPPRSVATPVGHMQGQNPVSPLLPLSFQAIIKSYWLDLHNIPRIGHVSGPPSL